MIINILTDTIDTIEYYVYVSYPLYGSFSVDIDAFYKTGKYSIVEDFIITCIIVDYILEN